MKIECTTTFLDAATRFESGDVRTVPDEDGARFCAAGWAREITGQVAAGEATTGEVSLVIENSTLGSSSSTL